MVVSHSGHLVAELGVALGRGGHGDVSDEAPARRARAGAAGRSVSGPGPAHAITLVKDLGETFVQGQGLLTTPPWTWGTRR